MLTTEELLLPRVKVSEEGYPDMQRHGLRKGQILTLTKRSNDQFGVRLKNIDVWYDAFFKNYPSIFKFLEWWEERSEADMPEYVKNNVKGAIMYGVVYKVTKILPLSKEFLFADTYTKHAHLEFKYTLPATQSEYEAQKQQK